MDTELHTESRRVRMTKRMIQDALIDLLSEKPIDKISIRALCEKADINRSTFYSHYTSLYDVMEGLESHIIERTITYLNDVDDPTAHKHALISLLTFYENNRNLYLILLENTQDNCYVDNLTKAARDWINRFKPSANKDLNPTYRWDFNTAGSVKLVRDWLKSDPRIPASDLADIMLTLTVNKQPFVI